MTTKKISVCMATFNGALFIKEQIQSILPQLSPNDEFLVADDGSTDETPRILAEYKDRIKLISLSRIGGIVQNFSRILSEANGDIVVFSDQDDVWLNGRIDRIRQELEHADLLLLNALIVDRDLNDGGGTLFSVLGQRKGVLANLIKNSFVGCCMAARKEVIEAALPMPRFIHMHDWYIGLVAESFFRVARIQEPYSKYRRHSATYSPTGGRSTYSLMRRFINRAGILYALALVWFRYLVHRKQSPA